MQFLNFFEGGKLIQTKNHVGFNHLIIFSNGMKRVVNSFHNETINENVLSKVFLVKARSEDNKIEMIEHKNFKWLGIMWHPERIKDNFDQHDLDLAHSFFRGSL